MRPESGELWLLQLKDNEELTIKRVYEDARKGPRSVRLQPVNMTLMPLYERPENIRYIGRVLTVIRDYEHGINWGLYPA